MNKFRFITLLMMILTVSSLSAQNTDTLIASKDAMIRYYNFEGDPNNHGYYEYINMHAWTNAGFFVCHRSLIDFDLSSINPDDNFTATLKLFSDRHSTFYPEGHQYLQEWPDNALLIQRITQEWAEYEVNWLNRPDATYENVILVKPSIDSFQDYAIDVTDMVIDMIADPENSHGFLIRIETEWIYSRMVFASSDNINEEFHPRLEIAYDISAINSKPDIEVPFTVYPNPCSSTTLLRYHLSDQKSKSENRRNIEFTLINSQGKAIRKIVKDQQVPGTYQLEIDVSDLPAGVYFVKLVSGDHVLTRKLIVE